ncbi:MAG: phosphate ABC transporter permease PstA [Christensenellales bacterium]
MNKRRDAAVKALMVLSTAAACAVLVWILSFIMANGLGHLTKDFLSSLVPQLLTTVYLIAGTLLVALPIGVGTAIYLSEYAKPGKLLSSVRFAIQCLSSIPSIIYGLFGYVLMGTMLKFGFSLVTGMFTLAVMVLPILISTTEEALMSVPQAYREGSWALGAGRLRTTMRIVLPTALPGVITAAILSIGRIVGETAAVYLTVGTTLKVPTNLLSSGRTLSVHLYLLAKEAITPDAFSEAYATATLLIFVVLGINLLVRLTTRWKKG